jgi:hypothetical protein
MRRFALAQARQYEKKMAVENGAEIYKDLTIERTKYRNQHSDKDGFTARLWLRKQAKSYAYYIFPSIDRRENYIAEEKKIADYREEQKAKYHRRNDDRSKQMKEILKATYPEAEFRVRIQKYSMGESIHVSTDLMKNTFALRYNEPENRPIFDYNKKIEEKIENLLHGFWQIARDESTGEILSGGNTYLNISSLRKE